MDEIRKELTSLKCIVCQRYLSVPPIYYTPSGDYRCGRCSFVKENLSFRAELYEKMAQCVNFPCIYQDCEAETPWKDVPDHETICPKQMIHCPFACDAEVDVKGLVHHFNLVHESLKLTKRNLAKESVLKEGEKVKLFYIVSEGEPFVVMFLPGNGEFKFGSTGTKTSNANNAVPATTTLSFKDQLISNMERIGAQSASTANTAPSSVKNSLASVPINPSYVPGPTFGNNLFSGAGPVRNKTVQPTSAFGNKSSAATSIFGTNQPTTTPRFVNLTPPSPVFSNTSSTESTNSAQPTSSSCLNQAPSTPKQSGLSVFSLFPSKPYTSYTLTFTSDCWKVDIRDQRVEPFITKEHCRKCWFQTCKNELHKPYSIQVDLNEFVITKFKSGTLSRLFQTNNVTFNITVHNKPTVDEKEKGPYVELSRNVQRALECPICTNIMVPPIFVCATGHTICTICKSLLTECPTCKAAYTGTRSFALEELYENSRLMCSSSNENNVCDFTGDVDEISKHDKCHETQD
ncbi:unnamed protein product [Phaedon cochleariae]|uniref:RING-type domain-containing protein n=1 Tax=Phaedon cochleariae TaxID=80249 RepID=A0A9N9SKI6_PHACE|nr:unnamed protein product [Phaedon cochleariae]